MLAALPGRPRRDKVSRFRADLITEGAYFVSGNWGANRGDSPSGKERGAGQSDPTKDPGVGIQVTKPVNERSRPEGENSLDDRRSC